MSQCHNVTMSQCHNVTISQCHNITMSQYHNVAMSQCHLCTDINNERRRSSVGFTSLQVVKVNLPQNTFTLIHFWHWCAILHIAMQKIFVYFVNSVADQRVLLLQQCWIYQSGQILIHNNQKSFIWLKTVSYQGIWRQLNVLSVLSMFYLAEYWRLCFLSRDMTGTQCLTMKRRLSRIGRRVELWGGTLCRFA